MCIHDKCEINENLFLYILLENATSFLRYLPKLKFACSKFGKYLSALPANFSLFDLSSPLSSFYYSYLASSLVLTVFFCSCRICHCEGDDESPLITPCHCTGSLRFVHQGCLQQWIKSSDTRCCELCKYEFIMETKLKPLRKVRQLMCLHICLKVGCIVIYCLCSSLSW